MRALAGAAAVLLLGLAGAAVPAAAQQVDGAHVSGERSLGPGVVELTITTTAFTAPTRVQVVLPAGYDAAPARRWPVVYYLHGAQGDETRFRAWYGDLVKDFPAIFVAPAGGLAGFYTDWFNGGAFGPPKYETYDIDQLIPLIDAHFRTVGQRAGRALIGESMGGYGVGTYATRHPDLFVSTVALSPVLDSNPPFVWPVMSALPMAMGGGPDALYGPRATQEVRWHGHNPTDLAENLRGMDLQVRTGNGTPWLPAEQSDGDLPGDCTLEAAMHQLSTDFVSQLDALHIPHVFKDYGNGCHTIPNFRREFADALPGLRRVLADPPPPPASVTYRSIEPHFSAWGWHVDADARRALEFLQLRDAGRTGLTLTGSGTTTITTPPFFRRDRSVDVIGPGGAQRVVPDAAGRLVFGVALGPADTTQQDTLGATTTLTTRTVRFVAHPRKRPHRRAHKPPHRSKRRT